jgi:hypothetical protein
MIPTLELPLGQLLVLSALSRFPQSLGVAAKNVLQRQRLQKGNDVTLIDCLL